MRLLRLMSWFGPRRGFRMWRRQVAAPTPMTNPAGWQAAHGSRPEMPGYRRRRRSRR